MSWILEMPDRWQYDHHIAMLFAIFLIKALFIFKENLQGYNILLTPVISYFRHCRAKKMKKKF